MIQKKKNTGFTLIELLVAMGIMAVLTGMAAFNFNQSRLRARDVQRKNDLTQLQKALELYKNDFNEYPATDYQGNLKSPVPYIRVNFVDPRGAEWTDYQYYSAAPNKTYYLMACLENAADATKATDETSCALFSTLNDPCLCGNSPSTRTGVMYIITNP